MLGRELGRQLGFGRGRSPGLVAEHTREDQAIVDVGPDQRAVVEGGGVRTLAGALVLEHAPLQQLAADEGARDLAAGVGRLVSLAVVLHDDDPKGRAHPRPLGAGAELEVEPAALAALDAEATLAAHRRSSNATLTRSRSAAGNITRSEPKRCWARPASTGEASSRLCTRGPESTTSPSSST